MAKVSVIIPSLYEKDGDYLKLCVESLRATVDWQIIVVTNGTKAKPNLSHIKGISQHLHTPQQGQCHAVNAGAQLAAPNSDYLMVSNADMYYAPAWLNNPIDGWDMPSCWSPNLIEPTNNLGSAQPFLKLDAGFTLEEFDKEKVDSFIALHEDNEETTGFNLPFFIRRDIWRTISGYDTKYDPWGSNSDTDLQTLIELAGVQPVRLRDILVYHFSNKSGTFDGSHQDAWQKNWDYYKSKWGFTRDDEPIPDTWAATDMVNKKLNKFHPDWENRYSE